MSDAALAFDTPVADDGYAWWYIDALSDDGRHGLTVIVFIGSVFSPYYAWARRRAPAAALNHCAFNIALYAEPGSGQPAGWTMTERGRGSVTPERHALHIGPSAMQWDGQRLHLRVCERTMPWGRAVRGEIVIEPQGLHDRPYALDAAGRHHWTPIAPLARVRVRLDQPALAWDGRAYLDSNRGERALAQDLLHWNWSRASLDDHSTAVFYDALRRDGGHTHWALRFGRGGEAFAISAPPLAPVAASGWGLRRQARADDGVTPRLAQSLEDGPFYARAVLDTQLWGRPAVAIHETLDMARWARPVVQAMLPFRMPRRVS